MDVTYEQVMQFTRSWDGVYFLIVFVAACVYALWPSNKERFRQAADIPLHDDEDM